MHTNTGWITRHPVRAVLFAVITDDCSEVVAARSRGEVREENGQRADLLRVTGPRHMATELGLVRVFDLGGLVVVS